MVRNMLTKSIKTASSLDLDFLIGLERLASQIRCGLFGVLLATTLPMPLCMAAEYRVVSDTVFPSDKPVPHAATIKATSDGGYLILGQARLNEMRLIKTNNLGDKQWEQVIAARVGAKYVPTFAIDANDGGYWVVGLVSEIDLMEEEQAKATLKSRERHRIPMAAFVAKLDAVGKMEWRNTLGLNEKFRRSRFICGVRTADGLVLIGTKPRYYSDQPPRGGASSVIHPWVVKLDARGSLLWESFIADEAGGVFSALYAINAMDCSGPYLDEDGSLTFGLRVYWHPTYVTNGVRIVAGPGTVEKGKYSFLVARVDRDGKEVARASLVGESPGFLLKGDAGFLAVTNPVPARSSGIRQTWLDDKLSVQRSSYTPPTDYSFVLSAGSLSADGGVHIVGQRLTPTDQLGELAMGYLSRGGDLTAMRPLAPRASGWNLEGYAISAERDEIAVVLGRDFTVRLLRFSYQN